MTYSTLILRILIRVLFPIIAAFISFQAVAQGDNCSNAIDLCSITSPYSSSTTGMTNDFSFCSMGSAEDMIFFFDLPNGESLTIGQTTNSYDSRHSLRYGGACPGNTEIVCTDDPDTQTESWTNTTGVTQRVYWIQAGWSSSDGAFTLAWSSSASCITNCDDPLALTASNILPEAATISWSDSGTGSSWNVELGTSGFGPTGTPTYSNVSPTTYNLSNLTPGTTYDYYVQSDCGSLMSNWVGPFSFTTPTCSVQPVSGLNAAPFHNGATLSWIENGNSTTWDIELGTAGFSPTGSPTQSGVSNNPYNYTGLSPSTSYDFYVRSSCGGSNSSWIGPFTFTTTNFPNNYVTELLDGWARGVVQDSNGDYVWAGYVFTSSQEFQVVKTDQAGVIIWTYTYGGTGTDMAFDIVNSGDGGYVITGHTSSSEIVASSSTDILVVKLDSNGNEVWSRVIGTSSSEYSSPSAIIRNPDGTYSIAATTNSDMFFIQLAANGTVLKTKTLNTQAAWGNALVKCQGTNNGWLVGGRYQGPFGSEFMVTKIKEDGTYDWSMIWGDGTGTGEVIYAVLENGPNDYTVFGYTYAQGTTPQNMYAARFTNNGAGVSLQWAKAYGQTSGCAINDATFSSDGKYVVTGSCAAATGSGTYSDTYLVKIEPSTGEIIWQTEKPDDGTGNRQGNGVIEDASGSFLVAGLGGFDMLKFGPNGEICDGITGVLVTDDLGAALPNVDYSEGTSFDTFGVSNASRSLVRQSFGTMLTGCIIIVLPIELASFEGECKGESVQLYWTTSTEKSNDKFIVERSINGDDFFPVGTVDAIGNSQEEHHYSFVDESSAAQFNYYRLKQVDVNGESKYSDVVSVQCNDSEFSIYPNPFNDQLTIQYSERVQGEYQLVLYNNLGQVVLRKSLDFSNGIQEVQIPTTIVKGMYHAVIECDGVVVQVQKIVRS